MRETRRGLEVTMLRRAIKSIQVYIYLAFMLVLYPVSRMYRHEYETIPIKFEFAFFMVLVALICNIGLLLTLSRWGLQHKKITCSCLVFTSLMNALLLLLTVGNPFDFVSDEYWYTVRFLFSFKKASDIRIFFSLSPFMG
jgi:RsiW-degrading membrane proteinase PrsW (M82 family)